MVIEGPIVNASASFAASLGYFNIFFIWIIAFFADLTGDIAYYFLGRIGDKYILQRCKRFFKIKSPMLHNVRKGLAKHSGKSIIVFKLTPLLAGPGLIIVGASRVPFKKYLLFTALTIFPITLFFSIGGYYLGIAFNSVAKYAGYASSTVVVIILLVIVLPYLFRIIIKNVLKAK